MGKAEAAKKVAATAVVGGGGLSLLGASFYGLLKTEAKLARRAIGDAEGTPPDATGWYGTGRPGPAIRLALLGDSSAAGYGVWRVEDTPGARLAAGIAEATDRRVFLTSLPVVGAQTRQLGPQVDQALALQLDLAVILIGANDVTHGRRQSESIRELRKVLKRFGDAGVHVIVGTCPDLGTLEPLAPPLRQVARLLSQRLATAQAVATVESGGTSVSLASILGAEFQKLPTLLFGPDRFHPSAAGYSRLASVLVPAVLAVLDLGPEPAQATEAKGPLLPIEDAAALASKTAGTTLEGSATTAAGRRPRFARLLRRGQAPAAEAEAPAAAEA
ncbi:MAG: SGNH/GDSL hydrolase family protein [Nocardioidaceae bacterium]